MAGCFTRTQLHYWAQTTPDVWVVSALSRGYHIQFHRRLPVPRWVTWTVIHDLVKIRALELATLLDKVARSYARAIQDTHIVPEHAKLLGLRVNLAKSSLVPTQKTVFLGVA